VDPPAKWEDPLFWLRDDSRSQPEVLEHLRAENAYTNRSTMHLQGFSRTLQSELLSYLDEAHEGFPLPMGAYEYYTRTEQGRSYLIHCRRPRGGNSSTEEVLLDENALGEGLEHFSVAQVEVSPTEQLGAFSADFSGSETYDLYLFQPGSPPPHGAEPELRDIGGFEWGSADGSDLFYTTYDEAWRSHCAWRHVLGRPQEEDERLYIEDDRLFYVDVRRSSDGQLMFVTVSSGETSEVHFLRLGAGGAGAGPLELVRPRQTGVQYSVSHRRGVLYLVTNEGGLRNNALRQCRLGDCSELEPVRLPGGREVLPHDAGRYLGSVQAFDKWLVLEGREDGLSQIWVLEGSSDVTSAHRVEWPDAAYSCGVVSAADFASPVLSLRYATLVLPYSEVLYHISERRLETVWTSPVPNYDHSLYATGHLQAEAPDGTLIPISLLWRRDVRGPPVNGTGGGAVHLYGYGSYGVPMDPAFNSQHLTLVDRGVVYAIAHVRGGGEFGRWKWYEEGAKYLNKKNSFLDFVACAQHLLATGWASPGRLSVEGRSAGGLLVTAALNIRPDLFTAAVAAVPFVDVLETMSDPSIPLTIPEWEEWGNPNSERYFEYVESYSPINNIRRQPYPSVLITGGLYDPRVPYWEPTKYAQVLREKRTNLDSDGKKVLLHVNLNAGHFSFSGRYEELEQVAFEQAWLLSELGLAPRDAA